MWNEHSVCERKIEDLKEEVEYYKSLFYNECEARHRAIDELHTRRVKELFELADILDKKIKKYEKVLQEIVEHSKVSCQGEMADNVLNGKGER